MSFCYAICSPSPLCCVIWSRRRSNPKRQPPEIAGSWPLIGHLHLLAGSKLPHIALANLANEYGPIFQIKIGVHPVLVVSSWELAKEYLAENDKIFVNRPCTVAVEQLAYNSTMFGFGPYGPYWRELCKIVTLSLLSNHRLEQLKHARIFKVRTAIKALYGKWRKASKDVASNAKEKPVDFELDAVIKATCLNVILGGTESSTVTLTWALSLLLNNRHVLKKAQDELDTIVGKERLVNDSDMEYLVYLQAIINETMQLHPAAPLSSPREAVNDCNISGFHVPVGTQLFVNVHKIHRDPHVWPDPREFQPERFLTTHKYVGVRGQNFKLIPFGSGRRICSGISFSLQIMMFTLANLLQAFEITTPSDKQVDLTERFGLTNMKETPLEVILTPSLPNELYSEE
ncbi:hypothetical protein Nepgr_015699 [Nepenthes gracilis]|uniref:Cytochrome P450 n=1 Tax=Nepenthes gracilis TaxID=150966 RepID=A0AAD3XQX8_NEPGR|nr:hypothetical protein Nepgr_015699 [Nepenthes gracilis]